MIRVTEDMLKEGLTEHCQNPAELLASKVIIRALWIIESASDEKKKETKQMIYTLLWERIFQKKSPITEGEKKGFLEFLRKSENQKTAAEILGKLRISQGNDNIGFIQDFLVGADGLYTINNIIEAAISTIENYPHVLPIEEFIISKDYELGWNYELQPVIREGIGTYWNYKTANGQSLVIVREDGTLETPLGMDSYDYIYHMKNGGFFTAKTVKTEEKEHNGKRILGAIWLFNKENGEFEKAYEAHDLASIYPDDTEFIRTLTGYSDDHFGPHEYKYERGMGVVKIAEEDGRLVGKKLEIPAGYLLHEDYKFGHADSQKEIFSPHGFVRLMLPKTAEEKKSYSQKKIGVGVYDPSVPGNFQVLFDPKGEYDGTYTFLGKTIQKTATAKTLGQASTYGYYQVGANGLETVYEGLKEGISYGINMMREGDGVCLVNFDNEGNIITLTQKFSKPPKWTQRYSEGRHYGKDRNFDTFGIQQNDTKSEAFIALYYIFIGGNYYYIGAPEKGGKYLDGQVWSNGGSMMIHKNDIILQDIKAGILKPETLPIDIQSRLDEERTKQGVKAPALSV